MTGTFASSAMGNHTDAVPPRTARRLRSRPRRSGSSSLRTPSPDRLCRRRSSPRLCVRCARQHELTSFAHAFTVWKAPSLGRPLPVAFEMLPMIRSLFTWLGAFAGATPAREATPSTTRGDRDRCDASSQQSSVFHGTPPSANPRRMYRCRRRARPRRPTCPPPQHVDVVDRDERSYSSPNLSFDRLGERQPANRHAAVLRRRL